MNLTRREFLQLLAAASALGLPLPGVAGKQASINRIYQVPRFGNVSLLHFTDCHAQLLPVWFREPHINIGVGDMQSRPPHLVDEHLLQYYGIKRNSAYAHALSSVDFVAAARQYGKVGGFAHLATLIRQLREQRPGALLLDGGDTWQGSATSLWTRGQDMIDASKLLGVDVMTGHWEFTFGAERVTEVIKNDLAGHTDFVAQNVLDTEWEEPVFKAYTLKEINGVAVAIIGQAFPYTPIANPRYLIPEWSFGIRDERMQTTVNAARAAGAQVVVLLSHNGMDVDLKMASQVRGIDVILGGHTHDAVPEAVPVKNGGGITLVINSGSHGKFLSVLDFEVRNGRIQDYRYHLLPVFADHLAPDAAMSAHIEQVRKPYLDKLNAQLGTTDELLYRRGNFNGSFDQVILDALLAGTDADIALSPGFRWGASLLPGEPIRFEDVMAQTAITYPNITINTLTGETLKTILEDVADNLYNKDPYYQQGGDMVRVGGLQYTIDPTQTIGKRISDMRFKGKPVDANKDYRVASWASVAEPQDGPPVWNLVADYIRDQKTVRIKKIDMPMIKGVKGNLGIS